MFNDMKMAGDFEAAEPISREFFERAFAEGNYQAWFYEDASGQIVAGGGCDSGRVSPEPHGSKAAPGSEWRMCMSNRLGDGLDWRGV